MTATAPQTLSPEQQQFDFWLGEWDVYDFSSGTQGDLAGTNCIERLFGGCVIQERWHGVGGLVGTSLNSYVALDGRWHQTWVDASGYRLELAGLFQDGVMMLEGSHPGRQAGVTVTNRISWNLVQDDPDRVRQCWQRSRDGGQSWETVFDGVYLRRAKP